MKTISVGNERRVYSRSIKRPESTIERKRKGESRAEGRQNLHIICISEKRAKRAGGGGRPCRTEESRGPDQLKESEVSLPLVINTYFTQTRSYNVKV